MALRRSTTSPNPAPTSFTGICTNCGTDAVLNAADFFTNATPGNQKPRSTVNHFGGSLGGPILHNKLFFFFDSEWVRIALPIVYDRDRADAGVPELRPAATSAGRNRFRDRIAPTRPRRNWCRSIRNCSRCIGTPAARRWPCWAVRSTADGSAGSRRSPERQRLRQSAERFAFQRRSASRCRPPASTTTSTQNNTAWFRFQADTGLQAAYTDPINPLFDSALAAAALFVRGGLYARFLAEPGELFQSGIFLVREPVRPGEFAADAGRVSRSCCKAAARMRRSRPSAGSTTPGCKAGALRGSSSTTTWPGPSAPTNCGSAPTPESSG